MEDTAKVVKQIQSGRLAGWWSFDCAGPECSPQAFRLGMDAVSAMDRHECPDVEVRLVVDAGRLFAELLKAES